MSIQERRGGSLGTGGNKSRYFVCLFLLRETSTTPLSGNLTMRGGRSFFAHCSKIARALSCDLEALFALVGLRIADE
jgi:hypothetical protein